MESLPHVPHPSLPQSSPPRCHAPRSRPQIPCFLSASPSHRLASRALGSRHSTSLSFFSLSYLDRSIPLAVSHLESLNLVSLSHLASSPSSPEVGVNHASFIHSSTFHLITNMDYLITLPLLLLLLISSSYAVNFEILNNCPFTVWAAATPVGGGQPLDQGQNWNINMPHGTSRGRIWGRTNCKFDGSGRGTCQTGDCGGTMTCSEWGKPPNTIAEFGINQPNNTDFFDISLLEGFNIPMSLTPTNATTDDKCHSISCTADIVAQCPAPLRDPGGCNDPCNTFGTSQYCCTNNGPCNSTEYSRFFKTRCPDAYSYPKDDATSTFTCSGGTTDYKVVFCP
nr:osmotin-like protein [Ipomoea batatas]